MAKTKLDGFADRLAQAREAHLSGLTQKDVGKVLGRSAPCIGQWEQGKSEPSFVDLMELAELYNVSVQWLLGLSDDKEIQGRTSIPLRTSQQIVEGGNTGPDGHMQASRPYPRGSAFAWKADTSAISRCASGDTVIIEREQDPQAGGIYMIVTPGTPPTLRRCQRDAGQLFFVPDAQGFPIYNAADVQVIGKVREIIKHVLIE